MDTAKNIFYITLDYALKDKLVPDEIISDLLYKGNVKGLEYLIYTTHIYNKKIYMYALRERLFELPELFIKEIDRQEYLCILDNYKINIGELNSKIRMSEHYANFVIRYISDHYLPRRVLFELMNLMEGLPQQKYLIDLCVHNLFNNYTSVVIPINNEVKLNIVNSTYPGSSDYLGYKMADKFLMESVMSDMSKKIGIDSINVIWKLMNYL